MNSKHYFEAIYDYIEANGPCREGQIARDLGFKRQHIPQILATMENRGLLVSEDDDHMISAYKRVM